MRQKAVLIWLRPRQPRSRLAGPGDASALDAARTWSGCGDLRAGLLRQRAQVRLYFLQKALLKRSRTGISSSLPATIRPLRMYFTPVLSSP